MSANAEVPDSVSDYDLIQMILELATTQLPDPHVTNDEREHARNLLLRIKGFVLSDSVH